MVSPEPDIRVYPVDISRHRCIVLGTDGAWNMLTPQNAISTVCMAERANEQHMLNPVEGKTAWINPSKQLVDCAIDRWNSSKLRADNTSIVTVMLDPPGPPRAQVLKSRKRELAALNAGRELPNPLQPGARGVMALVTNTTPDDPRPVAESVSAAKPRISIVSRFPNSDSADHSLAPSLSSRHQCSSPPPPLRDFHPAPARHASPPSSDTPPPRPAPTHDIVQCNEISSSEDSPTARLSECPVAGLTESTVSSVNLPSTSATSTSKKSAKAARRALKPYSSTVPSTRSSRSRVLSESTSDAENDAGVVPRTRKKMRPALSKLPETPLVDVEQRCQELNAKIEMMERKVASKTAQLSREMSSLKSKLEDGDRFLRSSDRPRLLRTRTPTVTTGPPRTPLTGKRKRPATASEQETPLGKTARIVTSQKPVVTRSRRARVLRLKK